MRLPVILLTLALSLAAGAAQAGEVLFGKARARDDVAAVRAAAPDAVAPKERDSLNGAALGLEVAAQGHFGTTWRVRYFFLDGRLDAVQLAHNPPPGRRADDIRQAQLYLQGLAAMHRGQWTCKQPVDPATTTYLDCDIPGAKIDVGYSYMDFGGPFEVIVYRTKRPL
ncbi:MAG: hypothetical protein Q7T61_07180 [Caulobacter sp.]|nr:hypothetical protein [Caulobacter sp.]